MRLYQESIDGVTEQGGPVDAPQTPQSSLEHSQQIATVLAEQFEKTREDFGDVIRGSYSGI